MKNLYVYMTLLLIAPFGLPKKVGVWEACSERTLCHVFVTAKACGSLDCKVAKKSCHGESEVASLVNASLHEVLGVDTPVLIPICMV